MMVEALKGNGILKMIAERLRIKRKGGYSGLDAFVFLVLFFTGRRPGGFKGLAAAADGWTEQLGALAGRRRMMTQQSLSRLLARVDGHHVGAEFQSWLLLEATDAVELLSHDSTVSFDNQGQRCRFLDLDGNMMVLRQRGLPEYEDMPGPERFVDESYAGEGYSGRKRGEIQLCREILQDAGTGLCLGIWCAPGNGTPMKSVHGSVEIVAGLMKVGAMVGYPVLRCDGAYGCWDVIDACASEEIGCLIRWSRYGILFTEEVAAIREDAQRWTRVEDSGSGPQRYAADIGFLTSPDGKHRARLVCSRYRDGSGSGVGCSIEGWRYELFVTSLVPEAWAADAVVTAYYGRVGQENRFAQQDREINVDSIFSTNIAGQALVSLIGFFVWNFQTTAGGRLHRDEIPKPPPQAIRTPENQPMEDIQAGKVSPLVGLLNNATNWNEVLPRQCHWLPNSGLYCPAGQLMFLKQVRDGALVFRALRGACFGCPLRADCTQSTQPRYRREIQVQVAGELAAEVKAMKKRRLPSASPQSGSQSQPVPAGDRWSPPSKDKPGDRAATAPTLLPGELRASFRDATEQIEVSVAHHCPPREPRPRFVALTPARRQQRRLTWAERDAWNGLPTSAKVSISYASPEPSQLGELLLAARGISPNLPETQHDLQPIQWAPLEPNR
jgi:hypothetical protein